MDKCPVCLGNMVKITSFADIGEGVEVYLCEDCSTKVSTPKEPPEVADLLKKLKEGRRHKNV